jgi:prepilin-type N-terminal cleavage/methylation domain-containing protein
MTKQQRDNKGFTLIELMVAMVVMAFGILGFIFLQTRSIEGRFFSREMNRAITVAQQQMDILMGLDFNDSLLSMGNHPTAAEDTADGNSDNQLTINYQNFVYNTTWISSPIDVDGDGINDSNFKKITVNCRWVLKDSATPHTYTLELVKRD